MIRKLDFNSKLSLAFFSLGLFSYVNRNNYFGIKPSEFFFICATLIFSIKNPTKKFFYLLNDKFFIIAFLALLSVLSSTFLNFFSHDLFFTNDGIRLIFKLCLNIGIFASFYIIYKDKFVGNFTVPISFFFIPYIFYIFFLFVPFVNYYQLIENWNVTNGRFLGVSGNPVAIAFPLVQAIVISFFSILYFKDWELKTLSAVIFTALILVLIWCGSRSAFLILFISLLISFYSLKRFINYKNLPSIFLYFIIVLSSAFLVVIFFNGSAALTIFFERTTGLPAGTPLLQIFDNMRNLYFLNVYNVRLSSFVYYKNLYLDNLLGLGVNYYPKFAYFNKNFGEFMPPDSFLDSFIHGGFLLVLLMLYLFSLAYNRLCFLSNFSQKDNSIFVLLALKMSLVVFLVTAVIGGFEIYNSRLWITLALCFALSKKSFKPS